MGFLENFTEPSKRYIDRTRQKHRLLILETCGYIEFTSAETLFAQRVENVVAQQMRDDFCCITSNRRNICTSHKRCYFTKFRLCEGF